MMGRMLAQTILMAFLVTLLLSTGGCGPDGLLEAASSGTGLVTGTVLDVDDRPVSSAMVTLAGTSWSTLTTVDGVFLLTLPAGSHTLTVAREGYETLSLPVEVAAGSGDGPTRRDFTLAPLRVDPAGLRLALTADGTDYAPNLPVSLTLAVTNDAAEARELPAYAFTAVDEAGRLLWQRRWQSEGLVVPAGETRTLAETWDWSSGDGSLPDGLVWCHALVQARIGTDGETVERLSSALRLRLMAAPVRIETVPATSLAQGDDSSIRERRGFLLSSADDWKHFTDLHRGPGTEPPPVDFEETLVLAAMGGGMTVPGRVRIRAVEAVTPTTGVLPVAKHLVRVELDLTATTAVPEPADGPAVHSPYHLVAVPRREGRFEFIWSVVP